MVEHGTVTADVSALVVVILVVCVLSLITRWVFKPSRPRTGPVVDATESTDLGMLDVLAADLSRADAMSLRAVLGCGNSLVHLAAAQRGRRCAGIP